LDAKFPNRWIRRDGQIPWPPRSSDITHLDFFLWGYVKDKVYLTPVPDIDTSKARIREALAAVTEEMLEKTWREIVYRLHVLRATNGAHVEVH
jgi:nicotinamide mononucleotide adenylyltransferase